MPNATYKIIGTGKFRTFRVSSELGNKTFKTYSEANKYVLENSDVLGEYRISMEETTILDRNGKQVNPVPK